MSSTRMCLRLVRVGRGSRTLKRMTKAAKRAMTNKYCFTGRAISNSSFSSALGSALGSGSKGQGRVSGVESK